ncbi:MAG: VIT domain-containing protein [Euryarchaeota archaeon]|nr:VIT domain-containing protein [Euryarchaeota archaeon]
MRIYYILVLMLIATSSGLTSPAGADGIIIVDPPPGVPIVKLGEALAIKYHHVDVEIEDQVATTRVDQVFVNDNPWTAEGTYIFPLPDGAAVSDFVMWVDGEPVRGEILEAGAARAIYNDIVRRMRDPALLEYVGRRTLKASVFPIPPGGERRIELEYSQVLPMENGLVHYVYPLSTEKHSSKPLEEVVITVDVESTVPIKAVYSPSHQVFVEREDDLHALLGQEEYDVLPDKDFEFYYSVSSEDVGLNLLSYKEPGEDGFFLLLAAPKVEVESEEVVAKDLILVLDVSGSMEGEKLDQAKGAALYVLDHLNQEDRFNVVAFSTGLRTFGSSIEPASKRNDGAEFVKGLEAMGGTDINRALLEAVEMIDPNRTTTVIFLTDGLATVGVEDAKTILKNVEDAAPGNVRIFSFGTGDDLDTDLLDQLSLDHGGASTYVRPGQRIDEAVSAFYAKISNPVLSNVKVDFGGIKADQIYPDRMPDLFAGSQLVLVGRYRDGGEAAITLSGTVNDREMSFVYPGNNFTKSGGAEFIPRLWATRAIGSYLTEIRLHGEKPELIDAIVTLSIRYGIITPYTSFLIEEDDIFTESGREAIFHDVQEEMAMEAARPSFGSSAVKMAAFEGQIATAEVPMPAPMMMMLLPSGGGAEAESVNVNVNVSEVIKQLGSKTFIFWNDTWIDTAFDRSEMETMEVEFLSDGYFDLVTANPVMGDYFALGERVIVVYDGVAYEVVEG